MHAIGSLSDVGARLLGAVLTMTPLRGSSSYSYNYGYYGTDHKASQNASPSDKGAAQSAAEAGKPAV